MRQGSALWGPFGPAVSDRGLDRNWPGQRETGDKAGWRRSWRRGRLMVRRSGAPKFIPSDVTCDVLIESG